MFNEYRASTGVDEKVLEMTGDDGCTKNVKIPKTTEL